MHFATKSAQDVRLQPFFEPEVALPSEIENHSDSDISSGGYRLKEFDSKWMSDNQFSMVAFMK